MSTLSDKLDAAIFQFHEKEKTFNILREELLVMQGSIKALAELVKAGASEVSLTEEADTASVSND